MNKRRILWYWLLILVPTLVAGVVLFHLLGHERERLERAGVDAATGQARLAAQSLDAAVSELQSSFTARLLAIPPETLAPTLRSWADNNPLVRQVFIWSPSRGLLLPAAGGRTADEELFARRYESLFSGRDPFRHFAREAAAAEPAAAPASSYDVRQTLSQLAKGGRSRNTAGRTMDAVQAIAPDPRTGWIPWFWESRLHELGWVQPTPDSPYYGIELETSALLAHLLPALQSPPPAGLTLVLLDGNGQPMHQQGPDLVTEKTPLLARVPVGPALPHWEIAAYTAGGGSDSASGLLFTLVSGLLIVILMAALMTGAGLLFQQAQRDRRDASRKTTFVSNVSHELKTPLTTLRMYAELLAEGRVQEPEKVKKYLGVMIKETERLTRLVNNVLDFSRLEQGRRRFNLEQIDAAALAREVLDGQAPRLREAGLALETVGLDAPAPVRIDRDALAQILLNLLDNAVKYAASGGRLAVTLDPTGGHTRIHVDDGGPGISSVHRGRLFEPFHRADDSLTTTHPGTGLGLSISRRLLRDMGGDLLYENAPGGGARFTLELPDENQDHPDR